MSTESEAALDFDKADFGDAPTGLKCAACSRAILDAYFEVNGAVLCAACHASVEVLGRSEGGAGRFVRATLFGVMGGALGAGLWYAVAALFNLEIGLIAIAVGWLAGTGVSRGNEGRGGARYQLLAAFITYAAIVTTYVPSIYVGIREGREEIGAGSAAAVAYAIAFAAPFLAGFQNILGILIICFAVFQAWSLNRKRAVEVRGPFRVLPG